jgi:hypothetical protein
MIGLTLLVHGTGRIQKDPCLPEKGSADAFLWFAQQAPGFALAGPAYEFPGR